MWPESIDPTTSFEDMMQVFVAAHAAAIADEHDRIEREQIPCMFAGCPNTDKTLWMNTDQWQGGFSLTTWDDAAVCMEHGRMLQDLIADADTSQPGDGTVSSYGIGSVTDESNTQVGYRVQRNS